MLATALAYAAPYRKSKGIDDACHNDVMEVVVMPWFSTIKVIGMSVGSKNRSLCIDNLLVGR